MDGKLSRRFLRGLPVLLLMSTVATVVSPSQAYAGDATTVCATNPGASGIFRFDGSTWTGIGGGAIFIKGGGAGLIMMSSGAVPDVLLYRGTPGQWLTIAKPRNARTVFAVGDDAIYGVFGDPGKPGEVYQWSGSGTKWNKIGPATWNIYAGGYGLFGVRSDGNIYRYLGSSRWELIGAPGLTFAVTDESVYGLTPDGNAIYRYSGSGTAWDWVGPGAWNIYAGGLGVFANAKSDNGLWQYLNSPGSWRRVGGVGRDFAVGQFTMFGQSRDDNQVWRWNGAPDNWSLIGGAAREITPCP